MQNFNDRTTQIPTISSAALLMAPTCSHILTNAKVPSESRVPSHSRNVSIISSTLHTNTTVHSQPTEPLLRPTTPKAEQYCDGPSHRPRNSEIALGQPRWSQSHVMSSHAVPIVSDKGLKKPLKRVKLLRWIRNGLAIVMGKLLLYLVCSWKQSESLAPYQHLIFIFAIYRTSLTIVIFSALGRL
jgi:hypothetical protein